MPFVSCLCGWCPTVSCPPDQYDTTQHRMSYNKQAQPCKAVYPKQVIPPNGHPINSKPGRGGFPSGGDLLLQPTVHTAHGSAVRMQHSIPRWGTECPWQLPVSRVQGMRAQQPQMGNASQLCIFFQTESEQENFVKISAAVSQIIEWLGLEWTLKIM